MTANLTRLRAAIQDFRFEDLFIEELGWDQYRDRLQVGVDSDTVTLNAIAQKRGMVAFTVAAIPEYKLRRKIEQQVAKAYRENIIIYVDSDQTQQVWQWVRRETGKPLANRERQFTRGQSGENIAQILAGIAFSLDEEDDLTIVDVTSRVRAAFDLERVTKRFYERFKRQHDAFLAFIEGIPDADFQRWYASVMLNRIMFIYFVQRNCRNIAGNDIEKFPVGNLLDPNLDGLEDRFSDFMNSLQANSRRRNYEYRTGPVEYQESYPSLPKDVPDKIDQVLARHYGFTDEELDFIINYDIKYRMGDDLGGDEREE